jgi:hypothetical protein
LESKSLARLFASFLFLLLCSLVWAGSFGRFGFTDVPKPPNWKFKEDGLKPLFESSDTLYFEGTVKSWKPTSVQASYATYALITEGKAPTRARINLFCPGPELLFEKGFALNFRSLAAPRLSWRDGSVGEEVEAAKSKWVAISYQDSQPPVLISFIGPPPAVIITGSAGDWTLKTVGEDYRGWVRFSLPLGVRALTTRRADMLGLMVKTILDHEAFWSGPSPMPISLDVENQKEAVMATWRFSERRAVVPFAAFLARRGGYAVQVLSGIREIPAPTNEGPLAYVDGKELKIKFPVMTLPRGRSLVGQFSENWKPPVADPSKPFSLFNAAISSVVAARPKFYPNGLIGLLDQYLEKQPFEPEPVTKSPMPYKNDGPSVSTAAFFALLQQGVTVSEGVNTRPNALYSSLIWSRDVQTWRFESVEDSKLRRRSMALVAVAGALSADPRMKLDAAMLEAGLVAERALSLWLGVKKPTPLIEPIEQIRRRLFKPGEKFITKREPVLPMLVNPVRVLIGPPLSAKNVADGYAVKWIAPDLKSQRLVLQSPQELEFFAGPGLKEVVVQESKMKGRYELTLRAAKPGAAELKIRVIGAKPILLPPAPQVIYNEVLR